jgi:alkylation response protein AidB-like acyl-CoA dehydrogenase
MDFPQLQQNINNLAKQFAGQRSERQQRDKLDRADFQKLHATGYPLIAIPASAGGLWESVPKSVRPICQLLRTLSTGDSSLALVSSMHPAVLSYWLSIQDIAGADVDFQTQCSEIYAGVKAGSFWGTITSEPGSGGDVFKTKTVAIPTTEAHQFTLTGQKHFGSGTGMMDYMVATALPEDEAEPDWFFVDLRNVPADGSAGFKIIGEWDGHGMIATQSHSAQFENFPATRIACTGQLTTIAQRTGGFIGCLFTSVILGIVDVAVETAEQKLKQSQPTAFEQVEFTRVKMEHWLAQQAFEGMLTAVELQDDPRLEVLQGKTAIAELAESTLNRLCKVVGGGSFSRRSPFGHWFEDVRAFGFLRPPWNLAYTTLIDGLVPHQD